jgi:phosphoribosylaminoimidazole-succinocarboxamide synthase
MYDLGDAILMVASDRISTYDAVHPNPIPDKGKVLTGLSAFWFDQTKDIVENHVLSYTDDVPAEVRGRAVKVRRLKMLPIECIVRGYITGSGWSDYKKTGTVSGLTLPEGLQESEELPEPLYTPSTKAEEGHDEAIDFERTVELLDSRELAEQVRDASLRLYAFARDHARTRGVILADTKFEFGLDSAGNLVVGDEVLTPDSSRYWPADTYREGVNPPSYDKQFVRDWLEAVRVNGAPWNKQAPPPALPPEVIARTSALYEEAWRRLSAGAADPGRSGP